MFKPKKIDKYCKDCGYRIVIKVSPILYNTKTGEVIKQRFVAHCWNSTYADEGTNRHYYKSWIETVTTDGLEEMLENDSIGG